MIKSKRAIVPTILSNPMEQAFIRYSNSKPFPSDDEGRKTWMAGAYDQLIAANVTPNMRQDLLLAMAWHTGEGMAQVETFEHFDQFHELIVDAVEGSVRKN